MRNNDEKIKQVLQGYLMAGLIDYDSQKVLSYLSDDFFGIGIGEQGFISSKEEVLQIINQGKKSQEGLKYNFKYDYIKISYLSPDSACLCTKIEIFTNKDTKKPVSGLMQSLILNLKDGKWLIKSFHASSPLITKEALEAYPLIIAENTFDLLKNEMKLDTIDIINQSISGGILATQEIEGDHCLYFINDSLLACLGYSNAEFTEKFKNKPFDSFHSLDKEKALKNMLETVEKGNEFKGRFRLTKKDGSYLWFEGRAKKAKYGNTHDILIGVLFDITEMINLQNELQEQANALKVSEERFRIALEKTSNIIFDYDIKTGQIIHSDAQKAKDVHLLEGEMGKALFIDGDVMDGYMQELNNCFKAIRLGEHQAQCTVKVLYNDGSKAWNKISVTGINDDRGKPVRAIGIIEDITKQKEAELAYAREEQYRFALFSDAMATYVVNFSANKFESSQVSSRYCINIKAGEPYDNFIAYLSKARMHEDYRRHLTEKFSKTAIFNSFENGESELKHQYYAIGTNSSGLWIEISIRLILDSATNEKKGFIYITDIDKKKKNEIALKHKSERDPMTGVYNKLVTQNKIIDALNTPEGIQTGVFMMIDVDKFKEINDTYGHPFGDRVLIDAASGIKDNFRENDIVGRVGGDEFCVFFSGMSSLHRVEIAAQNICDMFLNIFRQKNGNAGTSCSIGIAICDGIAKTFDQIYYEADSALYRVKKQGRNGYAFYDKNLDDK